jgi:poly(3-hydroxybutyrate) depolymerase
MELRRPLLVAAGAALSLLAGLPATYASPEPLVQAAGVTVLSEPGPIGLPGSTTTLPTTHTYQGQHREVVLHIPDGLLGPAPLVIALHAHSQEPDTIRTYSRLEQLADEQGFVVAFPEGAAGSWNAGACCFPASREGLDDVAFLDEVLTLVQARVPVDRARVHVTGGSNGAMMALRYACERPSSVASVAVVSGPLVAPCIPTQPVSVLVLHGAKDRVVPLKGGRNAFLDVTFPPVEASLAPFRQAGGDVRLQVVPRAGHEWMTRDRHGIDATRALWAWMRDHPRT